MFGSNMSFVASMSPYPSEDAHKISLYDEEFVVAKFNLVK